MWLWSGRRNDDIDHKRVHFPNDYLETIIKWLEQTGSDKLVKGLRTMVRINTRDTAIAGSKEKGRKEKGKGDI